MKLAVRRIEDHVMFTRHRATAWYLLSPVRWNWMKDSEQEALISSLGQRTASLIGHRLHLRGTHRNTTPQGWKNRLNMNMTHQLPWYGDQLDLCVDRLEDLDLSERVTFLGVDLKRPTTHILTQLGSLTTKMEMLQLAEQIEEMDEIVRGPGLQGAPATRDMLEWLLHRSVALGCPAPGGGDIDEACDRADFYPAPWGHSRAVRVEAEIGGEPVTRYVIVMRVGRMATLHTDDDSFYPWLARTAQLPFPVEIAGTIDVLPAAVPIKAAQKAMLKVRSQWDHYKNDHDLHPPHSLIEGQERAVEVQAEMETGFGNLSTRMNGWFNLAVSAPTEKEVKARAKRIEDLFQPYITIARPLGQVDLAKEFIPMERLSATSYKRNMPVLKWGGSQPAVTATVGHRSGMYLGYTRGPGGRHSVFWDMWQSQEGRGRRGSRSGVTLLAGGLGAGKSWTLGRIIYETVGAGIPTVALEPAGASVGRLPYLPELRPYAQHIDLFDAQDGILNIWEIIRDPQRSDFAKGPVGQKNYERALQKVQAQRWTICTDALTMMLPANMASNPDTTAALMSASQAAEIERRPSPQHVLNALKDGGYTDDDDITKQGRKVASILEPISRTATGRLIFPSGVRSIDYVHDRQNLLLRVITMRGAKFPKDSKPREHWTLQERQSMAVLNLALPLVLQSMYLGERNQRKLIAVDDISYSVRTDSGKDMIEEACLESRKTDTRIIAAGQNVSHALEAGIANWVDNVFAGRTENFENQQDLLNVMGVPTDVGYEPALGALSEDPDIREFLMTDGMGGCEKVVIDRDAVPKHVQMLLETTPDESLVGVA